jgi:outer membrane lipoprotein SlyB
MMRASTRLLVLALCAVPTAALGQAGAVAQPGVAPPASPVPKQAPSANCDRCGTVESIRQVTTHDRWTPLGTVPSMSDGTPKGVVMYQVGPGFTNQGQVLLGAAGGAAYKTSPTERNASRWEVVVRMDSGDKRTLSQNYEPMLREDDRVRVFGTQIELLQ